MKKAFSIAAVALALFAAPSFAAPGQAPPGEAPITPESAGRGGAVAVRSVVRITLRYLRDQVRLVVGKVVPVGELRAFLAAQTVDP